MITKRLRILCATLVAATLSACAAHPTGQAVMPLPSGVSQNPVDNAIGSVGTNLVKDPSFEKPVTPMGGFLVFSTGQTFSKWSVVGASGTIGIVSGTFSQNGFTFPAGCGHQWVDLTGLSQSATGLAQTVPTVSGHTYTLKFSVGNVSDPGGIFGTTSTVLVSINGTAFLTATNSRGHGQTKQVWKVFQKTFTAHSTSTAITFLNGDPSTDTNNGLDCISFS